MPQGDLARDSGGGTTYIIDWAPIDSIRLGAAVIIYRYIIGLYFLSIWPRPIPIGLLGAIKR